MAKQESTMVQTLSPHIPVAIGMIVGKLWNADEMHDPSTSAAKYKASPSAGEAVVPTPLDILCGKGLKKKHPGNCLFKLSVFPFVDAYAKAHSKVEKMCIVKHIVNLLSFKGMRFLKKSAVHNQWYVASQKMGRDKIGHFLRIRSRHPPQRSIPTAASPSPSFLSPTVWSPSSSSSLRPTSSNSSVDTLHQLEVRSSATKSAKDDVQSTTTTDCMIPSMLCDSKGGANESQYLLPFPSCNERQHNTAPYQVISGVQHIENLYEPNEIKLSCSSSKSAKEDVQSTTTTDCMIPSMLCDSKGANESQYLLQFPSCNERQHNTAPYQVISGVRHIENLYEPNEIKLSCSSSNGSTTVYAERREFDSPLLKNSRPAPSSTTSGYNMQNHTKYGSTIVYAERREFDSPLLKNSRPAPSSTTSSYNMQNHDLQLDHTKYAHFHHHNLKANVCTLRVPADSEEGKRETMLSGSSNVMLLPLKLAADMIKTEQEEDLATSSSSSIDDHIQKNRRAFLNDTERAFSVGSVDNQLSTAVSEECTNLPDVEDDGDEPLFSEQELAARLGWLDFPSRVTFL
jgi:hypothetical protein